MSVWTTRSLEKDQEYIIIKHYLPGINGKIQGVTFRGSYGVVEKGSKMHRALMRMPVFKNASELPLIALPKLPFITRTRDIENVYGRDVYTKYMKAILEEQEKAKLAKQAEEDAVEQLRREELQKKVELEDKLKEAQSQEDIAKVEEIVSEMPQVTKCIFETSTGTLCKFDAWDCSPSGHCKMHVTDDPKLEELGIIKPKAMTKSERKKFRNKLYSKLEKLKKSGAF